MDFVLNNNFINVLDSLPYFLRQLFLMLNLKLPIMKKTFLMFLLFGFVAYSFGQVPEIQNGGGTLTDITPDGVTVTAERPGKGDVGKKLTVIGDYLLFTGEDATNGEEVWVYNGVDDPTVLKDIAAGAASSDPNFLEPSLDGTKVFFSANDGTGPELWVTDGTAAGTMMVQDLNPGGGSEPDMITAYKDGVLFRAKDVIAAGQGKSHLFYSDGSTIVNVARIELRKEGDTKWKDIQVSYDGQKAFFVADDGVHGFEMWSYDGTTCQLTLDIGDEADPDNPAEGSTVSTKIEWPIAINNEQCMFRAQTPAKWLGDDDPGNINDIHEELWITDGTADGTYLLGDFNQAIEDVTDADGNVLYQRTRNTQFAYPLILKGMVMARADDGVHNVELCKFDNIPYNNPLSKSQHLVDMNEPEPNGNNGPAWTEANAVWNNIWIAFVNHNWPSESFDPGNGDNINHEMVIYDPTGSADGSDTVYAVADFWGPDDGLQRGWGKPWPVGANRRVYFSGRAAEGSDDWSLYYLETLEEDPTHTPVFLFNGPGDATSYIKVNYNEKLAFMTSSPAGEGEPDIKKLYVYDDGLDKSNAITDHGNGPDDMVPYFQSPGNIKTSVAQLKAMNFSVYPNPASEIISISMDEDRAECKIVNNSGQIVWKGEVFNNKTIDVSGFSPGSYILMVKTNAGVARKQLIIAK